MKTTLREVLNVSTQVLAETLLFPRYQQLKVRGFPRDMAFDSMCPLTCREDSR